MSTQWNGLRHFSDVVSGIRDHATGQPGGRAMQWRGLPPYRLVRVTREIVMIQAAHTQLLRRRTLRDGVSRMAQELSR